MGTLPPFAATLSLAASAASTPVFLDYTQQQLDTAYDQSFWAPQMAELEADGEWAHPRLVLTQFQNVEPNNLEQLGGMSCRLIVWPDKYKTGPVVYPYAAKRR